ncbi:MAG: hypothetical protein HOD06_02470 [Candidatus Komeilibacteria bacterium]|nr:hypothetical protein [Candidatus Komeilibacteria bacterium]
MIINKNNGFSLVEAIVYLAIVGILLTATVSLHLTLGGTADKMSSNILASRNRRVAMGGIDYLIKNADGLLKDVEGDCSSFGASPPILALYFDDDAYLPGTCVENGGGVEISVSSKKVSMTCYPNMTGNGYYQNCDESVYPAGNVYYLSSSDVAVLNSSLSFTTSTATSTANNFTTLTTNLSVGTHSSNQIRLTATSTATSTVIMRNEQADGLVSWYKFNNDDDGMATPDSVGSNDLECDNVASPTRVAGLVSSTPELAFDFEYSESDDCRISSPDSLAFSDAFTLSAWIKAESLSSEHRIINNGSWTNKQGYQFYVASDGGLWCRVFDGTNYAYAYTPASTIATDGSIYHVSCVYDKNVDLLNVYSFEKGVVGVTTGTPPGTVYNLVNNNESMYLSYSGAFDGVMDEVRFYNRALSVEEIWALQSQGAS